MFERNVIDYTNVSSDSSKDEGANPLLNLMGQNKLKSFSQMIPVYTHHFYLTEEIGTDISYYIDLINVLKTAESHDQVYIYLNTPGGALNTTMQILASMKQSQAQIITSIEGEVCSAGTLIFLASDYHIINGNCSFMIHNYSHMVAGKAPDVTKRVLHSDDMFWKIANNYYRGFLNDDEMLKLKDGTDYWMDSDEVVERLISYKPVDNIQIINCNITEKEIDKIVNPPKAKKSTKATKTNQASRGK